MINKNMVQSLVTAGLILLALYLGFAQFGFLGGATVLVLVIGWMLWRRRGMLHYKAVEKFFLSGDMENMRLHMKKAVEADPENAVLRSSIGFLYLKTGSPVEAERMLSVAIAKAKKPDEKYNAQMMMSLLLWKKGQVNEAFELLETVMESYRTTAAYSTMGFFHLERGDAEKALSFNREAYEYNSKNPVILDNYGSALMMTGDNAGAMKVYDELMKLEPSFPDAWYNYGRLLEASDREQEALRMYQTAASKRFWYTSTISRDEVEMRLSAREEKLGIATPFDAAVPADAASAASTASDSAIDGPDDATFGHMTEGSDLNAAAPADASPASMDDTDEKEGQPD